MEIWPAGTKYCAIKSDKCVCQGAKFKVFPNNLTRLFPHLWLLEVPQLLCNVVSLVVVRMMKLLSNTMALVFCIQSPLKIIREHCLQASHILSTHTCWFSVQLIRIPLAEESKSYGHHFHIISWLPSEPSPMIVCMNFKGIGANSVSLV